MLREDPIIASELAARELIPVRQNLPQLWGRRGFWQIKMRWAVAPLMVASVLVGLALGFQFPVVPILCIAVASLLYNSFFAWVFSRHEARLRAEPRLDRFFTILEVLVDYAAMFLLLHYTGGVASPLIYFLLFHIIIAAIQFSPATAFGLAGLAVGGLWALLVGELAGWYPSQHIVFRGDPALIVNNTVSAVLMLIFFAATLFLTVSMVSPIMSRFRGRMRDLAVATTKLAELNDKLNSLYAIVRTIGVERHLGPILETATSELAKVMEIPAVAVKLLSEDRETLRYVASYGLPDELTQEKVVRLDQSPLNRRIIEGETLVEARIDEGDTLQLRQELSALGIKSAILAPLKVEDRVIGTLGFYSHTPNRFQEGDTDFLQLAAELIAIAVDGARAWEAIEHLMQERTQFMLQVAHNLRAPLGAGLTMLDLLEEGMLGDLTEAQADYLKRIEIRLRSLNQTIGELLTIAKTRDWSREIPDVVVDLKELADYTDQMFRDEADRKGLRLEIDVEEDLPPVDSGADLLEQVMENLVSNAIKYTPEGGTIQVAFKSSGPGSVQLIVTDTGIGIPTQEQEKLFHEFFRASNAKKITSEGTGLGLVLVKQTVERHGGSLDLLSEEGRGTTVTIELPIHREPSDS